MLGYQIRKIVGTAKANEWRFCKEIDGCKDPNTTKIWSLINECEIDNKGIDWLLGYIFTIKGLEAIDFMILSEYAYGKSGNEHPCMALWYKYENDRKIRSDYIEEDLEEEVAKYMLGEDRFEYIRELRH